MERSNESNKAGSIVDVVIVVANDNDNNDELISIGKFPLCYICHQGLIS